jgi:uncharacterized SAM-binding protein YcdF (DUF218 family)
VFYLSKIGWLLVQPLSLGLLLILAALFLGLAGWRRLQVVALAAAAVVVFVTIGTTAGTMALQALEDRIPRREPAGAPVCLLVLGGGFEADVTRVRGGVEFNQAGERYMEALRLSRLHPQARIIVSGGDGSLTGGYEDDFTVMKRLARDFGLEEARLLPETGSRNTFENMVNSAAIMKREGLSECLLVTSAFHMPRALGMARKAGVAVRPWPVDYRTDGRTTLGIDLTEPTSNAQKTATALREWLGLFANYLAGRSERLFPEP